MNEQEIKLKRCPNGEYRNKITKMCEPKLLEDDKKNLKRCPKGEHRNKTTKRCEPKKELSKRKTQKMMILPAELRQAKKKLKPLILPDIAKNTVSEDVLITVGNLLENLNEKGAEYAEGLYYIGANVISDILFFYLMKKYGNKCFLYGNKYLRKINVGLNYAINIDLISIIQGSNEKTLVDITNATPEIQSFFHKINTNDRFYINNYNILYNTIVINNHQIDNLLDCMNNSSNPIIIMPLTLSFSVTSGHRNMLIYRRDKHVIEHFEPHGGVFGIGKENKYELETILELLVEYISIYCNKKLIYISSLKVCPADGPQRVERGVIKTLKEGGGYCVLWSYLFAEVVLLNPTISSNAVFSMIMQLFNSERGAQNFLNIIRGYVITLGQEIALYLKKYFSFHLTIQDIAKLYQNKKKILNSDKILTCIKTIINLTFDIIFNLEGVFYSFIDAFVWDKKRPVSLDSIKKVITEQIINIPEFETFKIIDTEILPKIIQDLKTKQSDEELKLYLDAISAEDITRLELINYNMSETHRYYNMNLFLRVIKDEPEKYRELFKIFKSRLEKRQLAFKQQQLEYDYDYRMKQKAEKENKRQTKKKR